MLGGGPKWEVQILAALCAAGRVGKVGFQGPKMTSDTPPSTRSWFPPTSWTLVVASGEEARQQGKDNLNRLCQSYWKPVYWHIHFQWKKSREDSRDLTQAFFAWLLERDLVADADPNRGRFRAFLKTSLDNFLRNQERYLGVQKRGGEVSTFSLEHLNLDPPGGTEQGDFDQLFAASVLEEAVFALEERCVIEGKAANFQAFESYYLGEVPVTHAVIASKLKVGESTVRRHLAWSLQAFTTLIRTRLSETLFRPEDLDDEMMTLFEDLFR